MTYTSIFTNRIHQPHLDKLDRVFFADYPCVRYDRTLEGQRVQDGVIVMGLKAGPDYHVSNLIHEMCHLVEIDDDRTFSRNWGLSYGRWVDCEFNGGWHERRTPAHILREIRVWAYQLNVSRWVGMEETAESLAVSSIYLPDTWLIKSVAPELNVPYAEFDRSFIGWVGNEIERLSVEYSFDRFCLEWHRKLGSVTQQQFEEVA